MPLNLGKVARHKKFKFSTRYYDAEKEALDKRVRAASKEASIEERIALRRKMGFEEKLDKQWSEKRLQRQVRKQKMRANLRFFIILNILVVLTIYIFVHFDLVDRIF